MWKIGDKIGDREGRLDIGVAAAGVFKPPMDPLTYPADVFRHVRVFILTTSSAYLTAVSQVMDVNINGALYTAQAAGRQMARFGSGGSVILVASAAGYIAIKVSAALIPLLPGRRGCSSRHWHLVLVS